MALVQSRIVTYGVREYDALDVRDIKATTSEVALIRPVDTATTQADANEIFVNRLTALEPLLTVVDGGTY